MDPILLAVRRGTAWLLGWSGRQRGFFGMHLTCNWFISLRHWYNPGTEHWIPVLNGSQAARKPCGHNWALRGRQAPPFSQCVVQRWAGVVNGLRADGGASPLPQHWDGWMVTSCHWSSKGSPGNETHETKRCPSERTERMLWLFYTLKISLRFPLEILPENLNQTKPNSTKMEKKK